VDDLRSTVVRENADGSRILLQDIASVTDGLSEATTYNRSTAFRASACRS
jgi:HAE1 family hydrophobic/amphiphilic exporter-1